MPAYEVEYICPLSEGQRDELAAAITKIHAEQFGAPSLFVNVRFTDVKEHATYVGGKRVSIPGASSVLRSSLACIGLTSKSEEGKPDLSVCPTRSIPDPGRLRSSEQGAGEGLGRDRAIAAGQAQFRGTGY